MTALKDKFLKYSEAQRVAEHSLFVHGVQSEITIRAFDKANEIKRELLIDLDKVDREIYES